jgi:hypothetical protein
LTRRVASIKSRASSPPTIAMSSLMWTSVKIFGYRLVNLWTCGIFGLLVMNMSYMWTCVFVEYLNLWACCDCDLWLLW